MLNPEADDLRRNETIARSLFDDHETHPMALGCGSCPHLKPCGGLYVGASLFDCSGLCSGNPSNCTRVCRNNVATYANQLREIGGFTLDGVQRVPEIPATLTHSVVPLIYHGGRRARMLEGSAFALRLSDLVNYRTGEPRFTTRGELDAAYRIAAGADLIVSGVDTDRRIEPWWRLGDKRPHLLASLSGLGVHLVTAPNFSVKLDRPRTDDLHAMKRIAQVFAEFQNAGIACALHPNGRTLTDSERWAEFVAERPEVGALSYEFITGSGRKERIAFHVDHLARIAARAGRDLDIIVRGEPEVIETLRDHFRRVVYVETTSFVKSVKRQRAFRVGNDTLEWRAFPTTCEAELDALFAHNIEEQRALLQARHFGTSHPSAQAA